MEELIERVSAIFDSPVLGYSWHKTYRQMSLICLVYFLCFGFNSFLFAKEASKLEFKPYQNNIGKETQNLPKSYEIWNKNVEFSSMESVDRASDIMNDVDKLFGNLKLSIYELVEADPVSDDDRHRFLKGLAELDGVLSYVQQKLRYGKDQLSAAMPVTSDDIAKCNSLKIRFMANIQLANDLKKLIADKLAKASK